MIVTKKDLKFGKRTIDSHKGQNGTVLVVGGSIDYVGAVLLAGMSALRTGADLVVIAAPEKVAWAINSFSPDFITRKFKGEYFTKKHAKEIIEMSKGFNVTLIGNGTGTKPETKEFIRKVVEGIPGLKVIDADAIKCVRLQKTKNSVITPHKKEMDILLENSKTHKHYVKELIGNNVILLKGKVDEILSKEKTVFNKTGNAGMTIGGTGDVLAGITAGILSQTKDLFSASYSAAFVNGTIGDELYKEKGYGFVASEMVDRIPMQIKKLRGKNGK
ncbi:MAG: NAD(P)H-hydrate dehydratase [bacterium]|nr:NAD(P)H-hydrate dehydratase [bacterium]